MSFNGFLKQSTAVDILLGPFVDEDDGKTAETALTISQADVLLSKNGQALTQKTDVTAAAHDANGFYNCELDATDTNTVGQLAVVVFESGALPVRHEYHIVEEAVYDALYGASAAGPLQSTTAGRTLDVTATGAAGIDWGNVENPTTAVDLSATDIQLCDTVTTNTDLVSAASVADAVWDEPTVGHTTASTFGEQVKTDVDAILSDTGTTLPGTLTTIEGKVDTVDGVVDAILVDTNELQGDWTNGGRLDLLVDAILADTNELQGDWTDGGRLDLLLDAILADTSTDGVAISATVANQIADAILNRDFASVSDTNARTALNALRFLRNKWSITGTTLTVTEENDTTAAWTATVSTDATADPVTGNDPA